MQKSKTKLDIKQVSKSFIVKHSTSNVFRWRPAQFQAVDSVSITVEQGRCVGLVGESGSGKSTVGRIAAGIIKPDMGEVSITPSVSPNERQVSLLVQMIFQNPLASLNPRQRVGEAVVEAAVAHNIISRSAAMDFCRSLFEQVGLDPETIQRFPHEFSGGQRQRIALARAVSVNPAFLVLDEAVSALDVSVQVRVVSLLKKLQDDRGLGMLFISHDLDVVRSICDYVYVMNRGRIVEQGAVEEIFQNPKTEYTDTLLKSMLRVDDENIRIY